MKIVGCDLHARQQSIAMLDTRPESSSRKPCTTKGAQYEMFTLRKKVRWW